MVARSLVPLALLATVVATACDSEGSGPTGDPDSGCAGGKCDEIDPSVPGACDGPAQRVALETAFGGVRFTRPVGMVPSPVDSDRFYVIEQRGVVWSVADRADPDAQLVLDFRSAVNDSPNEAGLLGIAFHPQFAQNGEVYLSYTAPSNQSNANLQSRISRFRSTDGGRTISADSEEVLLRVEQPFPNHNGGHVVFGPDGLLYAGFGDGGSAGDPLGNGQDRETLLGSIIRIDVDRGNPYAIPSDNPFASGGGRPEIFALGIRNPWRFSFDREDGDLWLADVGQNRLEEIDVVVRGGNYGWPIREGTDCFNASTCQSQGLVEPVWEYPRSLGISVTGGFRYRGSAIAALRGSYIYGDYGSGRIWALLQGGASQVAESGRNISAFAEDRQGEIYALDHSFGSIFKLVGGECVGGGNAVPNGAAPAEVVARYAFLSRDGIGTESEANGYYASIIGSFQPGVVTLDMFENAFMTGPTVSSFYRNDADLGSWREMVCSERIDRGTGACWVRTWPSEAAFESGSGGREVVAMNVSPEGFVRFYSFTPDGVLSPTTPFDSEGPKAVPRVCTACHNGQYLGPQSGGNTGAVFREFEPSLLTRNRRVSQPEAEQQWLALNIAVQTANLSLATEAQGGPVGITHARQAMIDHLNSMYTSLDPATSRAVDDPAHIPPSWQTGQTADEREAKAQLWSDVVMPYCMTCHRSNSVDFSDYAEFLRLGPTVAGGESVFEQYMAQDPQNPGDLIVMPQTEPLFDKLQSDGHAADVIDRWLALLQ